MSEKKIEVTTGLGFGTILFLVFLVLKLMGTIDWSWWWITAPLWMPLALVVLVLLIFMIIQSMYR